MARDIVIWVGSKFYPKPEDFIREAAVLGVSRKLPSLPVGLEVGRSRVFLMHQAGTEKGKLIGYYIVGGLEVIVHDPNNADPKIQEIMKQCTRVLTTAQAAVEPKRGCGYRSPGGVYLVNLDMTQDDLIKLASLRDLDKDVFMKGKAVFFPQPYPMADAKHFRGCMFVDGDELLGDLQAGAYKGSINYYRVVEEVESMRFGVFIEQIAQELGESAAGTERVIRTAFSKIKDVVTSGDDVRIPEFGRFTAFRRAPGKGYSKDRGVFEVPSQLVPKFRPAESFRAMVKTDGRDPSVSMIEDNEGDNDGTQGTGQEEL